MESDKKSNGAVIGIIVIILVLIIGGYWFWKQNRAELGGREAAPADELGEAAADEIIFEDEAGLDELFLDDDLTGFDSLGGEI